MNYDSTYFESKDIDWFFKYGDTYVHVASAGGKIPVEINAERNALRSLQHQVSVLPDIFTEDEIIVNNAFLSQFLKNDEEAKSKYVESFVSMSRKGFVSIDRTNFADLDDDTYHIVCKPPRQERIDEIEDMLLKVNLGDIRLDNLDSGLKLLEVFGK